MKKSFQLAAVLVAAMLGACSGVMMIMYRCLSSIVGLPLRSSLGAVSSELHSMSVLSLDR